MIERREKANQESDRQTYKRQINKPGRRQGDRQAGRKTRKQKDRQAERQQGQKQKIIKIIGQVYTSKHSHPVRKADKVRKSERMPGRQTDRREDRETVYLIYIVKHTVT